MPVPSDRPSRSPGGGGYGGGYGSGYGPSGYDSFSIGCYYWGGRYYYADGYYTSPYGDGFGFERSRWTPRSAYTRPSGGNRLPIFFPPTPPPLDTPAPAEALYEPGLVAPSELAAYVDDPFYAPLSTRLAQRNLTDNLRRRLEAYRDAKADLQAQLHAKLATLSSPDSAATERGLATFAVEQTPRIAELEASAERLRIDLLRGGLVGLTSGTGDWNEHRTWRLGTGRPALTDDESLIAEFRVVRAAIYYQEGLAPSQRRLLREVAMELQAQAFAPDGSTNPADDDNLIFFSPATARVRLPADLPVELTAKLTAYRREKSALKAELHDTLVQLDRAPKTERARAMKQLAVTQSPRLSALEEQAEEIRRRLVTVSSGTAAASPAVFPPELAERIGAYRKQRVALQEEVRAKLDEIGRSLPPGQVTLVENVAGPDGEITRSIELHPTVRPGEIRRLIREDLTRFNSDQRKRAATLQQEWAKIRAAAATFMAAHPEAGSGKTVDQLLQAFAVASGQKEARPLYEDYATAVFQPGLSPEQRRLLFDSAMQKLALPLPGGERQP